jgi:anti-sigma factor RsiW
MTGIRPKSKIAQSPNVNALSHEPHLAPEKLLMAADGELPVREQARAEAHLVACWTCRSRKQELEAAIGSFLRFHRDSFENCLPPQDGPRALLFARLRQSKENEGLRRWFASISDGPIVRFRDAFRAFKKTPNK